MPKKSMSLIIVTLMLAAILITGLAGCTSVDCTEHQSGITYNKTITTSDITDPTDSSLKAHVYCLNTDAGATYIIEIQSLSNTSIQVWECGQREAYITEVSVGTEMVSWTFDRDGEKEIWIEAYEYACPAEYILTITEVRGILPD